MLVTLHCAPVVLPLWTEPVHDGAVAVSGDRVVAVGPRTGLVASYTGARMRSWPGVLLPGLVNAHVHLQYTDFADLAGGELPFDEWLAQVIRRRHGYTPERWAASTRRGIHDLIANGTTACADVVSDPGPLVPTSRSGLAGVSYIEAVGADTARWRDRVQAQTETRLDAAPPGRAVGISPHTLYTLSLDTFAECVLLARKRGIRLHPHVAETAAEVEYVARGTGTFARLAGTWGFAMELAGCGTGRTPVAELNALGGLGDDVHIAHGVHCDASDRALLRERGTAVALCWRSNRTVGAGEPPVAAYLDEGSPFALGTDSLASSPSLDLLAEASSLRDLAQKQGYRAADLDRRLVEAVTRGGARAMGLDDIGLLGPGARADFAAFDVPVDGDPYTALLDHGPGRCAVTVIAGRIVHRGRDHG